MTGASYVFSVDLEDVRLLAPGGLDQPDRVVELTGRYLRFLSERSAKGTFFVVGNVARRHPELLRRILSEGHEIACHSDDHVPLDRQNPSAFRDDVRRNLDALHAAGAEDIHGYRAPCFSITQDTRWAYDILAELGFRYSSSVLPAKSPIYGWPSFGAAPRLMHGVLEIPITLHPWRTLPVPLGGGVYFRGMPSPLLKAGFRRKLRRGEPVLGYLHPYDIDEQRLPHPGFSRWSPYNWLLRYNREAVLPRLLDLMDLGFVIETYRSYASRMRAGFEQ